MAEFRFRTFKLFKDAEENQLGSGAYGTVCKALCDGLLCAAKIMHPYLVTARPSKHGQDERLPWKRFEAECNFLCSLRHPNIVQYLDKKLDPDSKQSVLLMELMDESLTRFLDKCKTNLPFYTEVNICHDIALALSFLHSNNIAHRDLSSNNILMLGQRRAKISDFGMARMFDNKARSLTSIPGTKEYMPPEVFLETPLYNTGVDCFSYGVLALQVITRAYPEPLYGFVAVVKGTEELLKKVPEIIRRQGHIDVAPSDHLLLPVIKDCLKDKPDDRPNADDISSIVSSLVQTNEYIQSKEQNDPRKLEQEKEKEISQLIEKNRQDIALLQNQFCLQMTEMKNEYDALASQLLAERHDNNHIIMEAKNEFTLRCKALEEERDDAKQRLKLAHVELADRDELIRKLRLQRHISQRSSKSSRTSTSEGESDCSLAVSPESKMSPAAKCTLLWKASEKTAVRSLVRNWSDCVLCNNCLFIQPLTTKSRSIYGYHCTEDLWEELPPCPHDGATLARINNTILALGGKISYTNFLSCIYYLTRERGNYVWKEAEFQLPTKRSSTIAINTEQYLIVAGGENEESSLKLVEVMDTGTYSWTTAASLPEALLGSSATVFNKQVFLVGGQMGYNRVEKNWVYTCSIEDLIESRRKIGQRGKSSKAPINTWKRVVGPPVTQSSCICVGDNFFIIGGVGEDGKPTAAVYAYWEDVKVKAGWYKVGYMTTPRSRCFAVACEPKKILVIGGYTNFGKTNSMESTNL